MDDRKLKRLEAAIGTPPEEAVAVSRGQVARWFEQSAPLIQWDVMDSPLGMLYVGFGAQGLRNVAFRVSQAGFMSQLDPLARTERNPVAVAPVIEQLHAYFAGARLWFDLPVDLGRLTPFQQSVLQTIRVIPVGAVWTYGQVARSLGRPKASRAVGQALGRNPVPIVVPCHRVVASGGRLGGYSAGGGLESKRYLLGLEGAL
jgi:methylated-DNA-[protein]-cysteine S-methyltransferase